MLLPFSPPLLERQFLKRQGAKSFRCSAAYAFLVLCLLLGTTANAADYHNIGNVPGQNFGTWADAGTVSMTYIGCVASANTKNKTPHHHGINYPYILSVESLDGGGDFYLYLDNDSSNTGDDRILMNIYHRDILDATSYEQFIENSFESQSHLGQFKQCVLYGDNSEFKFEITGAELASKNSGTFQGNFKLHGLGGSSFNKHKHDNFNVSITVDSTQPQVRITGMDDIDFGQFSGAGSLQINERFCVYASDGNYNISVSSSSQDGSGNFYLPKAAGGVSIPISLYFIDSGSGSGNTQVFNAAISGVGDASSETCSGTNNATLTFSMDEQSLRNASSGNYLETFTLLIQPE